MNSYATQHMEETMRVVARAEMLDLIQTDKITLLMDLDSAGIVFDMNWDELLAADNADFAHDIVGIQNNINREIYPATDFRHFVPRFAGRREES